MPQSRAPGGAAFGFLALPLSPPQRPHRAAGPVPLGRNLHVEHFPIHIHGEFRGKSAGAVTRAVAAAFAFLAAGAEGFFVRPVSRVFPGSGV